MNRIKFALLMCSLLLFSHVPLSAHTLHAIIFANTKCPGEKPGDPGIGPSVTVDFQRMGLELTTISKSIGYQLKKYYYYDTPDRFCRSSLDNVLNSLTCDPDDIVFFYYSGHGGRAENEQSSFPEMVLKVSGTPYTSDLYPLYNVYKRIRRKSPRLTIVMGDLCNSLMKGFFTHEKQSKGATVLSKNVCDVYKNLFLNVEGGLITASSKPGQTSGCNEEVGGFFTISYLSVLQYYVKENRDISWEFLMDSAVELTKEITGGASPQTPIYLSELQKATHSPSTSASQTPQTPLQSNDAATNLQDKIAYAMSMVGNKNVSLSDRIRNIQTALGYVSPATRIQVVGCDNSTIVNTTTAEKYLNYLSIASNINQIVVLDMDNKSGGTPTSIRVHEIHFN